ncbi:IclR family transcriptional regulator [Lentzea sp. NPDC051838]|uniref:IclR family transcriptional regulator n=1 Tax=Lentzea sp. NPDC051838 TaxID=3154849 RepID=UPI0034150CCE
MAGNTSTPGASVVERVLAILECFDVFRIELTLTEISRQAELPLSTARRLLAQLVDWGALERTADNHYRVGMRLWHIGILAPKQRGLREAAMPLLSDLYSATDETVQLVVPQGHEALCVEKVFGPQSAPTATEVGGLLPLHTTAVGKSILAHSPRKLTEDAVSAGLARLTPYSIVHPARLVEELKRVAQSGVAYSHEEMTIGAASVAAPIVLPDGTLLGAVGIVVRSTTRVDTLAAAVRTAARTIARFNA